MEHTFDRDFSAVRVHETLEPQALGANAFTRGADIFFAPGQYAPGTARGTRLLAHELTHVAQEQDAPSGPREQLVSSPSDDAEREASSIADRIGVPREGPMPVRAPPRAMIHRSSPAELQADLVERAALLLVPFVDEQKMFTRAELFAFVTSNSTNTTLVSPKLSLDQKNPNAPPSKEEDLAPVIERMQALRIIRWDSVFQSYMAYNSSLEVQQQPRWGTEESTAPVATSPGFRPQARFAQHFMDLAGRLVPWIDTRTSPFTRADLLADNGAMALVGNPTTEDELKPMLDLLVKYGVLLVMPNGSFRPVRPGGALSTERFDKAAMGIADPTKTDFEAKYPYPKLVPDLERSPRSSWSLAGEDEIVKNGEKIKIPWSTLAARADLADREIARLEQELKKTPNDTSLQNQLKRQQQIYADNTRHWSFARSVAGFFAALRQLTNGSQHDPVKNWTANTYGGHQWEEYSADIHLGGRQPWDDKLVVEFFALVNQAAEAEHMAWRAVYDHPLSRNKANELFGARRVLDTHGEHQDHIHLNVVPTEPDPSEVKGFK